MLPTLLFALRRCCAVTALLLALCTAAAAAPSAVSASSPVGRERLSLDHGWLFHLGDIVAPEVKGHGASYGYGKAGFAWGPAGTTYDDGDWRALSLPHDWAVEGPFDAQENLAQGYRPRGVGWYRRYLCIEPHERGRQFELQFDAIATHATVWVNGILVHRNWSGYNASNINITPYLRYGDEMNTIAVRADAVPMEGWWYEGAGIYRHAWLVKRAAVHIVTDGLHATPRLGPHGQWSIPVAVTLKNAGKAAASAEVEVTLRDPSGALVASRRSKVRIPVLAQQEVRLPLQIARAALWSLQQPQLYQVSARVIQNGSAVDETSLHTGLREIRFDPEQGAFLNGQHVKLQGVSIHQDHAGVGVAVPDAIWAYRLRRLKELGANAIRFTHGAPAAEVLDLADRMGFLVMDENRNFNISPDYLPQLEWLVRRDRHHPSVVLWSLFNEEPMQSTEAGYEMARTMAAAVKALDDTRPVTAAMNGGFFAPFNVGQALDVVGANYQVDAYDKFHQQFPKVPFTSSEDTSAFMTRGVYRTDQSNNVFANYDDDYATWGNSHRDAWEAIARRPFVAGGFVWTGFDYRGEPTPNQWPAVNSVFGIMDLNGFAKNAYYIHQVQWIRDQPLVHIAPHWNWAGREGQEIRVMVMSNTDRIALLLNGGLIGEQRVDPYRMNYFKVPYAAGKLEALAYRGGQLVAQTAVETTGVPVSLALVPDRAELQGDGRDAMPITVQALDAQGRPVPLADAEIRFSVQGEGQSLGHGNGDPTSHEDEKGPTRRLFNGLAQLIVQSLANSAGELVVEASADGLAPARLVLPVRAVAQAASQPVSAAPFNTVNYWRISPLTTMRPDPNQTLADFDMNTWEYGDPPMLRAAEQAQAGYRIFRASFTPRRKLADGSGILHFQRLLGRAEIWLDGQLIGRKDDDAAAPLRVTLPAGAGARQLNVLIEAQQGQASGIEGVVRVEPATL